MAPSRGDAAALTRTVTVEDTAQALGSGDVPVLSTPRLLAWCEAATVDALAASLPEGGTSVGTRVSLEHLAASAVGAQVLVRAVVVHVDGRLVRLDVVAEQQGDEPVLVGRGEVTRVLVDREQFLARVRRTG